jgi:hypothetical protein
MEASVEYRQQQTHVENAMRWDKSGGRVSGGDYTDLLIAFYVMCGLVGAIIGAIIAAIWNRTKKGFIMWIVIGAVVGALLLKIFGLMVT